MDVKKWRNECVAKDMVNILEKNAYDAHYADNIEEATKMVLDMIPEGASIALGGSVTLNEMGLVETFRDPKYKLFDRYQKKPWPEIVEIYRESMLADFMVTSTNAITKNGELVNTDSTGNRVAAMMFGPKRVIVVAGANKVVENIEEAHKRIREIAPMNSKRIGHQTPCTETGKCEDCEIKQSICNYTGIIHNGRKFDGRITVIMIGDEVGY